MSREKYNNKGWTIAQIRELIEQLKKENDPTNKALIDFYNKKIASGINKALSKALK